jgi:hypothetical protein
VTSPPHATSMQQIHSIHRSVIGRHITHRVSGPSPTGQRSSRRFRSPAGRCRSPCPPPTCHCRSCEEIAGTVSSVRLHNSAPRSEVLPQLERRTAHAARTSYVPIGDKTELGHAAPLHAFARKIPTSAHRRGLFNPRTQHNATHHKNEALVPELVTLHVTQHRACTEVLKQTPGLHAHKHALPELVAVDVEQLSLAALLAVLPLAHVLVAVRVG